MNSWLEGADMSIMYHDGNRDLQDRFDSRRIADRLEEKLTRTAFTGDDKVFIDPLPTRKAGRIARSRPACRVSCG